MLAQLHTVRRKLERLNVAKGIRNVKERTEENFRNVLPLHFCLRVRTSLFARIGEEAGGTSVVQGSQVGQRNLLNYVPLASRV